MRPAGLKVAVALAPVVALLGACGSLDNNELTHGDIVGRVLRGSKDLGRVVLMGDQPSDAGLQDDGSFRLSSVPAGAQELLIVANGTEALRLPVMVGGAELVDLQDVDPQPAAFIAVNLTTQGVVAECSVTVHQTDLAQVHAPSGSTTFLAGPLGAGCYDASMEHGGSPFWTRTGICLGAGEQQAFDVTW